MRQSELLSRTRKEAPRDEVSNNAKLLIKAGYISKQLAGVYAYLPLGLRVLEKIIRVIREEMNAIGGQELLLSSLQDGALWSKTKRWDDPNIDVWFKTELKNKTALGLGFTHEEPIANTLAEHIKSYKQLPVYPYQIQLKFRNETRAKSGIMRTREFLMKDLYSLSRSEQEHEAFYKTIQGAYMRIFKRCGIAGETYLTVASGGVFSDFSHEFQTVCGAGEDIIYVDEEKKLAVNKEVYTDEVLTKLGLSKNKLVEKKSIEVGNIFPLGTRFSEPLNLKFTDEEGIDRPVIMGSYGIGPGRLMGTVVELLSDSKGIVWPQAITPFHAHLISLGNDPKVQKLAEKTYDTLTKKGFEVLWDDRDESAGVKLNDADLIGITTRLVIGSKSKGKIEYSERADTRATPLTLVAVLKKLKELYV